MIRYLFLKKIEWISILDRMILDYRISIIIFQKKKLISSILNFSESEDVFNMIIISIKFSLKNDLSEIVNVIQIQSLDNIVFSRR